MYLAISRSTPSNGYSSLRFITPNGWKEDSFSPSTPSTGMLTKLIHSFIEKKTSDSVKRDWVEGWKGIFTSPSTDFFLIPKELQYRWKKWKHIPKCIEEMLFSCLFLIHSFYLGSIIFVQYATLDFQRIGQFTFCHAERFG